MEASYIMSAYLPQQLPPEEKPEIAFIGRSNVGKSSFLNALVNRKQLAFTGQKPGVTQMVNFFSVDSDFTLVDLPGYGYRQLPVAMSAQWQELVTAYLQRSVIKGFFFLRDVRREFDTTDIGLIKMLLEKAPIIIILTKIDKLKQNEKQRFLNSAQQHLEREGLVPKSVHLVSSLKKTGISEALDNLKALVQSS